MRRRDLAVLALGLGSVLVMPIAGAVAGRLPISLLPVPNTLSYVLVGGYAVHRRPEHRAARRLLLWGATIAFAYAAGAVVSAVSTLSGPPPWTAAAVVGLQALGGLVGSAVLAFVVVFPDGRYHSRLEPAIVRGTLVLLPVALLAELLGADPVSIGDFVWDDSLTAANPLAVPALAGLGAVAMWVVQLMPAVAELVGAILLLVRWRGADTDARRRIAWPLAGVAATAVCSLALGFASSFLPPMPFWLQILLYLPVVFLIPATILIGMLWYDLLDIGVVVRRSVLFAALWLVITVGYVLLAGVAGVVADQRLPLAVAVATTVVLTIAFAAGRRRLEALADRLVFGRRVDRTRLIGDVISAGSPGAAAGVAGVAGTLADAVRQGVRAEWTTVRIGDESATAAREPSSPGGEPVLEWPIVQDGTVVGQVRCGPREIGRYGERERALGETLGRQAAVAVALQASRVRILRAEEAGRRRLERDLHDGVQQDLVGLLTRLGLAANQLKRDPVLAGATLTEARSDARRTLEDLQDLVRGIHPTLLTDRGLVAAVQDRASRMPMAVRVDAPEVPRLAADVEGAAYFVIAECLTNAAKHADARSVCVRIDAGDALLVDVTDDGCGFDPGADNDAPAGSGLTGLRDRVEALGGTLTVVSAPGCGTSVRMCLPIGPVTHDRG